MTYSELVAFCGSERQAHFLSTRLPYRDLSEEQLIEHVAALMVRAKERTQRGQFRLEYVGGQRRDLLRAR